MFSCIPNSNKYTFKQHQNIVLAEFSACLTTSRFPLRRGEKNTGNGFRNSTLTSATKSPQGLSLNLHREKENSGTTMSSTKGKCNQRRTTAKRITARGETLGPRLQACYPVCNVTQLLQHGGRRRGRCGRIGQWQRRPVCKNVPRWEWSEQIVRHCSAEREQNDENRQQ
jgi:hypothetical protein